jgi:integrase
VQEPNNEKKLGQIAQIVVCEFRKANLNYDQSRYIFKLCRTALDLKASRKGLEVKRSLSDAQVESFFRVISNPTDLLIFKIIYCCALRVSALACLKREDVSLDEFTVTIRFSKTSGGVIPFPKSLRPLLQMHLQATSGTYLFQSSHKRPFSTRALQLKYKTYAKMAGLPNESSIHCLRHSVLTSLASKGLTGPQLQGISLHRSKASLDSYIRLSAVEVRGAYDEVMK